MNKNVFLTGFMGSGKSRIGKLLANRLNISFIDTDKVIEEKEKSTITQLFNESGEKQFRKIETKIISDLIAHTEISVFSLGGGSLLVKNNLDMVLKSGVLIYIESSLEAIWERTKNNKKRPLLLIDGEFPSKSEFMQKAQELLNQRLAGYKKAQYKINRDGKEAEEVAEEIINKLNI